MYYLIPIPIVIFAVIIKLVSDRYKLKIFSAISKIVIILGVIAFIYFYAAYLGYDMIEYLKVLFAF